MRFTVVWSQAALNKLADIWVKAANRNAVTAAQHQIGQLLRVDPDTQGQRFFGDRVLAVAPLVVRFSINRMDMMVEIHDVW
jgi:hypothetical protein